jgi:hypothetical protein
MTCGADGGSLSDIHRPLDIVYLITILQPDISVVASWIIYCLTASPQLDNMRILCLHGYGTGPDVMKAQMSELKKACDPSWEFHFLGGKVICPPAPGELIVIELSGLCCVDTNKFIIMIGIPLAVPGPYLCYSAEFDPVSMRAAHALVNEAFHNQGPFDGVFGFSQGASVLISYLLEQIVTYPERPLPVRFGIFCSAVSIIATDPVYYRSVFGSLSVEHEQHLRSGQDHQLSLLPEPARTAAKELADVIDVLEPVIHKSRMSFLDRQPLEVPCALHPNLYEARLPFPSLHVRAKNDPPALRQCSLLAETFCLPRLRRSVEHSAVHSLPRSMADVRDMVFAMRWVIEQGQRPNL